jgi:NAD(P)-dependent dehydrogenase (short-subunit alcohol dehydrogenase family)
MKTAFVTGANRGIGKGFVEYLLDQNYQVFAGTRTPNKYPKELGKKENLQVIQIDIANDKSIEDAAHSISEITKHLDLVVNCAGVNKDSATDGHKEQVCKLEDLDRTALNKMFDVNATSQMMLIKGLVPLMTREPSFIINISSGRASFKDEYPNSSANYGYRASKAALTMLTFCSVYDLPKNVKTFSVHPGGVKTDMNPKGTHNAYEQAERMLDITRNWRDGFNGQFLRFDGGFYPL